MSPSRHLRLSGVPVTLHGSLDLLETRLVQIAGNLDPTPHGRLVAEQASLALIEHSDSCALLHDGPGIAAAALDCLATAAPRRIALIARRGVTAWHRQLASAGALVLEGPERQLLRVLADACLIIEQHHDGRPDSPHIACTPGPILAAATTGSNRLLLHPDVEIVPDLEQWARRLRYIPARPRHYSH